MTLHHAAAAPCCAVSPRSDRRHFILLYELCLASYLVTLVTVLYFLKLPSDMSINVYSSTTLIVLDTNLTSSVVI